ncbi:hypothetical protein F4804DRAFT_337198 [Jackrogersella minutella]|nr:hypothetical protein F4804DRAFT_337198 [Jackrogersella minutella]
MQNLNVLLALIAASSALAQTLPPSPTASTGCELHEDHWHCDGPVSTTVPVTASSIDDDDDDDDSQTLEPSPTESTGCEAHGDHWHCESPASVTASSTSTPTSDDHDDHDDHDEETGSLSPSPTESVGCEAHGNHWHCDGPAVTSSTPTSSVEAAETGGAERPGMGNIAIIGGLLAAVGMGL